MLGVLRDPVDQSAHLGEEPHVCHLVGLVEGEDLHRGEVQCLLVAQVLGAARSGHQDVHRPGQGTEVAFDVDSADDLDDALSDGFGQRTQSARDLLGELTGRDHDQPPRTVGRRSTAGKPGDHWQTEGEGLAGAGGPTAEDVPASQGIGDGGGLDGEGVLEALGGQFLDHRHRQTHVAEGCRGVDTGRDTGCRTTGCGCCGGGLGHRRGSRTLVLLALVVLALVLRAVALLTLALAGA